MAHWTNEKVVAAWVDRNQRGMKGDHGHTDNISFTGRVLSSFGCPIACFHTGPTSRMYVLFSKETERRKSGWRISNHGTLAYSNVGVPKFRVTDININDEIAIHENNLLQMYADFKQHEDDCIRHFRVEEGRMPIGYKAELTNMHADIRHYIDVAGIDSCPPSLETRLDHVQYQRMKRWDNWMEPRKVAKRERAAARKLAKEMLLGH